MGAWEEYIFYFNVEDSVIKKSVIAAFAMAWFTSQAQQLSVVRATGCQNIQSGKPYAYGDPLILRLSFAQGLGVTYRADLTIATVSDGPEVADQTRTFILSAFGQTVGESEMTFNFQIPPTQLPGKYLISNLTLHEVPGVQISQETSSLMQIIGTCVTITAPVGTGKKGTVTRGVIVPHQ